MDALIAIITIVWSILGIILFFKVTIAEYGTCTFEGVWEGKYAFYPDNKTDLPNSPYLVNDVEPYLLIPKNKLTSVIV